jgi:hypothetical protein
MSVATYDPAADGWSPFGDRGFMDHAGSVWMKGAGGRMRYALLAWRRRAKAA